MMSGRHPTGCMPMRHSTPATTHIHPIMISAHISSLTSHRSRYPAPPTMKRHIPAMMADMSSDTAMKITAMYGCLLNMNSLRMLLSSYSPPILLQMSFHLSERNVRRKIIALRMANDQMTIEPFWSRLYSAASGMMLDMVLIISVCIYGGSTSFYRHFSCPYCLCLLVRRLGIWT